MPFLIWQLKIYKEISSSVSLTALNLKDNSSWSVCKRTSLFTIHYSLESAVIILMGSRDSQKILV